MSRASSFMAGLTLAALVAASWSVAADPNPQECGHAVCRLKPVEKEIKKPAYSQKCVPYCQTTCSCCLCKLFCLSCDKPRYKRVLMRRQIAEKRCQLQCVLEHEPCTEAAPCPYGTQPPAAPALPNVPPLPGGPHPPDRP